ncbi:MAG: hypothetical protein ACE5GR_06550 [Nitrosopumilus sp.]
MNKLVLLGLMSIIALAAVSYAAIPAQSVETDNTKLHNRGNLAFKTIPANDYMHLFDSTPDTLAGGHFAIKVNCDENGNGAVDVLMGVAPEMNTIKLTMEDNMVHELSTHGQMCLYHIDLPPEDSPDMKVTDIAISNPSDHRVRLGPTASYTIYVNAWGEQVEEEDHHG